MSIEKAGFSIVVKQFIARVLHFQTQHGNWRFIDARVVHNPLPSWRILALAIINKHYPIEQ